MVLCIHYSTWCAYIYIPPSPHKPPCFCGHKATCLLTCLQTGFTWSLKVWEKWDKLFKDSKVWENWVGSVNFVVFRAVGKNYQLICQKLHFSRPNSRLKKLLCKIIKNALPIMNPVHIHSIIVTMTESIIMHTALHLVMLNSCSWRSQGLHWLQTGHFWQLSCITDICSWISWLKTTYGHFLDTQIHTSNKRTFANTAQMMMKLCLEALNCSDCMMI